MPRSHTPGSHTSILMSEEILKVSLLLFHGRYFPARVHPSAKSALWIPHSPTEGVQIAEHSAPPGERRPPPSSWVAAFLFDPTTEAEHSQRRGVSAPLRTTQASAEAPKTCFSPSGAVLP